jgi:hypothetical protein
MRRRRQVSAGICDDRGTRDSGGATHHDGIDSRSSKVNVLIPLQKMGSWKGAAVLLERAHVVRAEGLVLRF